MKSSRSVYCKAQGDFYPVNLKNKCVRMANYPIVMFIKKQTKDISNFPTQEKQESDLIINRNTIILSKKGF